MSACTKIMTGELAPARAHVLVLLVGIRDALLAQLGAVVGGDGWHASASRLLAVLTPLAGDLAGGADHRAERAPHRRRSGRVAVGRHP